MQLLLLRNNHPRALCKSVKYAAITIATIDTKAAILLYKKDTDFVRNDNSTLNLYIRAYQTKVAANPYLRHYSQNW
jgi:hypothetical protein